MVRFKVVKASHILLAAAILVLAVVLCLLAFHLFAPRVILPTEAQASFVDAAPTESDAAPASALLPIDPERAVAAPTPGAGGALSIEVLDAAEHPEAARILIYHTHTHEAYQPEAGDPYPALEPWRTADNAHNVVRVGEELAGLLRNRGFEVVHDTTDHEQDELSTAYTRSLETLESYDEPFDLYIDLHRDAYEGHDDAIAVSSGQRRLARLMVLIGRGEGFAEKPFYEENLAFAEALTERLNNLQSGICRDVLVKKNRYNQHIGIHSILIEVGNNQNTLSEALAAMPVLADGLEAVLREEAEATVQLALEGR